MGVARNDREMTVHKKLPFQGVSELGGTVFGVVRLLVSRGAPALTVFADPIEERAFETDVVAKALRFEPLVFQDFFSFRQKLLIETGLFDEFAGGPGLLSR